MSTNEVLTVAVLVAFAGLLCAVWGFDRRRWRSGSPLGGVVGAFDEVFHPEAARAAEVRQVQRELPADAGESGDPLVPGGTVTIRLSKQGHE